MNTYLVELTCSIYIEAENEDEAVEKAYEDIDINDLYAYVDGKEYG